PKVFAQIRARTGRDFARYKRSTILRRITRRMQIRRVEELEDYLELLRGDAGEVRSLADDLLITVTSFFRDPEVYEALEKEVIPALFEGRTADDMLRVWSVGCATGEEAYSLAMLLVEEAGRRDSPPRIQVFASDLHDHSLEQARQGFYPGDIATDVSAERLKRFFTEEDGGYRIRQDLRELVVFSPHNLLGDPPFSRMDLISCRNVLIYLDRAVQPDVVDLFHYALRDAGFLVLGTSETVEGQELFQVVDKKRCIYRRRNVPAPEPRLPVFPLAGLAQRGRREGSAGQKAPTDYSELHQRIIERHGPPSALVSPDDRVVHLSHHGGRYLMHPGGEITSNVYRLVRDELRIELRSALHEARRRGAPVRTRPQEVRFNGDTAEVMMEVRPALEPGQEGYVLVLFAERPAASGGGTGTEVDGLSSLDVDGVVSETELQHARDQLQSIIEEYETSQEELRASNEELQSSNEELRSTMEELETSKEELQSMNEELQTVAQENRHKVEELSQLSGDLQNLLSATEIATLFLDREMRIVRYTPRVAELFNVRPVDRGRPVGDLTHRLRYPELQEDARRVLERLIPIEREVRDEEGRWFLTRVLPYRSREDRIEGTVATFVEITERKRAEEELRDERVYAESIVETLHEPLLVLHPDLRVRSVNQAFYDHFEVRRDETIGRKIYDLGNGQWDIPELRTLLEDVLPDSKVFNDYEVRHTFEDIGEKVMLLNARRLDHVQLILLGIRDITEHKRWEQALRESEERFRHFGEASSDVLWIRDAETLEWEYLSPAFEAIYGRRREDALGPDDFHTWLDLIVPDDREVARAAVQRVRSGERVTFDYRIRRPDGEVRWLRDTDFPIRDGEGVRHIGGIGQDVTEQKETEEALRQWNERLEERVEERTREVRDLAETLSMAEQEERQRLSHLLHDDLQQLLYGIQMKVTLALEKAGRGDPEAAVEQGRRSLELLEQAITRTRQLTVDLNPPILEGEGLVAAIEWLRTQMRDLHGLEIEIHAAHDVEVYSPETRVLLFQIARELLFNVAKHADTDRAVVEVVQEDGRVRVSVADQGKGFDPEILSSAKRRRGGLGLFSARERLRMRGGGLNIESVPGNGTRIVAYAPLTPAS
ncbi:MAG: CheR family methyltransferase, partial [Gemmatimonadota bacterium]